MAKKTLPQVPPGRKTQPQPVIPNPQVSKNGGAAVPEETPYDRIGYLATARLKIERGSSACDHVDAMNSGLMRAKALAEIVEEASHSESGSQFPTQSLVWVMMTLQEEIEVVHRLTNGLYDLYREAVPAKAD